MITIIWRPRDTYYGIDGKIITPTRTYSGYIDEDRELEKYYRRQLTEYRKKLNTTTYLNKVLVKEALNREVGDWIKKLEQNRWTETVFYLTTVTITDLTQMTPVV